MNYTYYSIHCLGDKEIMKDKEKQMLQKSKSKRINIIESKNLKKALKGKMIKEFN